MRFFHLRFWLVSAVILVVASLLAAVRVSPQPRKEPNLAPGIQELLNKGEYTDALALAERNVELTRGVHGEEGKEFATALNYLAVSYRALGRYEEAIPLFQRMLEIHEKIVGPDSSEVAGDLASL